MAAVREHLSSLFTGLGAELPLPTQGALAVPPHVYVAAGVVLAALLFVKDALISRDARRGRVNAACCVALFAGFQLFMGTMLMPLFHLVEAIK